MESELRFYYPDSKYNELCDYLKTFDELNYEGCFLELTIQYDHPMNEKSFYSKSVDGRFRVRTSQEIHTLESKSKISWKQRTEATSHSDVNTENEVEVSFEYNDYEHLKYLLENVIGMKKIESYERYRNVFSNEDVEIVVDKYPFGIALEIENKSDTKNAEDVVLSWVNKLNLNKDEAYRLSWDDKYTSLCQEQGIEIFSDVTFDKVMPQVK